MLQPATDSLVYGMNDFSTRGFQYIDVSSDNIEMGKIRRWSKVWIIMAIPKTRTCSVPRGRYVSNLDRDDILWSWGFTAKFKLFIPHLSELYACCEVEGYLLS